MRQLLVVLLPVLLTALDLPLRLDLSDLLRDTAKRSHVVTPTSTPLSYFPVTVGSRWVYDVELFSAQHQPLAYELVSWPFGNQIEVARRRRALTCQATTAPTSAAQLIVRVVQLIEDAMPTTTPSDYARGFELVVEHDDCGIYKGHKSLFWALPADGSQAIQVISYSAVALAAASHLQGDQDDSEVGSSRRLLFFNSDLDTPRSLPRTDEMLMFIGPESIGGTRYRHFRRLVAARPSVPNRLVNSVNDAFVEDTWFERGVGLFRLEQRVNDAVTMIWTLRQ